MRSVSACVARNLPESNANEAPGTALSRTLGAGQQLRIATATDGSTLAQEAICKAGNLAQLLGALLTVYVVASDRKDASHSKRIMEEVPADRTTGRHTGGCAAGRLHGRGVVGGDRAEPD